MVGLRAILQPNTWRCVVFRGDDGSDMVFGDTAPSTWRLPSHHDVNYAHNVYIVGVAESLVVWNMSNGQVFASSRPPNQGRAVGIHVKTGDTGRLIAVVGDTSAYRIYDVDPYRNDYRQVGRFNANTRTFRSSTVNWGAGVLWGLFSDDRTGEYGLIGVSIEDGSEIQPFTAFPGMAPMWISYDNVTRSLYSMVHADGFTSLALITMPLTLTLYGNNFHQPPLSIFLSQRRRSIFFSQTFSGQTVINEVSLSDGVKIGSLNAKFDPDCLAHVNY
jgi:hypothetical protein